MSFLDLQLSYPQNKGGYLEINTLQNIKEQKM